MSSDVVRLPLRASPSAVRVLAVAKRGEQAASTSRLLELRDAAVEQRAVRQAVEACQASVERSLGELKHAVDERLEAVAAMITELGIAVAGEIIGATLARGTFDALPVVRRCLQQAVDSGDRGQITVRLSPADHARVETGLADPGTPRANFVVDAALAPGSVRVETDIGAIAYDPLEVFRRLSDELRKELAACR